MSDETLTLNDIRAAREILREAEVPAIDGCYEFVRAFSSAYDNLMPRRTATGAWKVGRRRYSSFNLALWAAGEEPQYSALTYGDGPFPPRRKRGKAKRKC